MHLNLPIYDAVKNAKSILIAGMGGGFDVLSGLPIFLELERLGHNVHLASLSFSDITGLSDGEALTDTLVGVTTELSDMEEFAEYFPEYYLAQWFYDERNEDVTIWCFEKTGARPLLKNYQVLVKHLGIDAIILVDGGIDSLMHGDEPQCGTLLEDSLSLLAVNELNTVPIRLIACLGLGIESEIAYPHLFENMAQLTKAGAFKGSCSLLKEMPTYQQFEEAALYIFDQQPTYPSVICASVISAVRGEYGDYHLTKRTQGSDLRISALMPIYWFFDLPHVARQNLLLSALRLTYSVEEAWTAMQTAKRTLPSRKMAAYPLPE